MKFTNKYKNLKLVISKELISKMDKKGIEFHPNEIGGFLIGYYSSDLKTLHINDFIIPKKYKSSSHLFERSVVGIANIFKKIFIEKKHYYIGEWHTHPNGLSMYSDTDLNAMKEIAQNGKVIIENPILLILSINKKGNNDFSFYLYVNEKLIKYDKD